MSELTQRPIILTERAARELQNLPKTMRRRMADAIEELRSPEIDTTKAKKFQLGKRNKETLAYRIRVGQYRALYTVEDGTVTVHRVRHRKDAYR